MRPRVDAVHPVMMSRDVVASLQFYEQLSSSAVRTSASRSLFVALHARSGTLKALANSSPGLRFGNPGDMPAILWSSQLS